MTEEQGVQEQSKKCYVVINAGSSSFKFSVFIERRDGRLERFVFGEVESTSSKPHFRAKNRDQECIAEWHWEEGASLEILLTYMIEWIEQQLHPHRLVAIGHRMVHGGQHYHDAALVTEETMPTLRALTPFAPLHQPRVLAVLDILLARYPDLTQVACFDTAFHATNPRVSQLYGLPASLTDQGVIRYGFHGSSYEYVSEEMKLLDPWAASGSTIVAHLGSGASMCALVNGKSVASTMGFSALDGLVMGTRCGTLDPGVILYLLREHGMTPDELETMLYKESGMLGISGGVSDDVRDLLASDEPAAREAIEVFVYRVVREIGSLAAAAGGMDALVFTAGIGEHSPEIRAAICSRLAWMGVELDPEANRHGRLRISSADSQARVWIVPANEEVVIARHTARMAAGEELQSLNLRAWQN